MIGIDMYTERWYESEDEAKKFLEEFFEKVEEEKGYKVKSERTVK